MKTTETITVQQADEGAVHEHVLTGKPLDPEVHRRVRARAEKITAELRRKYGDMNISADLIREVRDEEGNTSWIHRRRCPVRLPVHRTC